MIAIAAQQDFTTRISTSNSNEDFQRRILLLRICGSSVGRRAQLIVAAADACVENRSKTHLGLDLMHVEGTKFVLDEPLIIIYCYVGDTSIFKERAGFGMLIINSPA